MDFIEIEPRIFVVNDTALPDTPEQAQARERRAAAAKRPRADPRVAQAAREAKWKRTWEQEFAPWLHRDLRFPDGTAPTLADRRAAESAQHVH